MTVWKELRNALSRLRHHGLSRFAPYVRYRCSELWYERYFRVQTDGCITPATLGIASTDSVEYFPTPYQPLNATMRRLHVQSDDVLVDFGSGKGRIVVVAATLPFRRVIGVELSAVLAAEARDNVNRARRRFKCDDVEILSQDATRYSVPDDATVLHFFNPFHGETLQKVVRNIRDSLAAKRRELVILFANPTFMQPIMERGEAFPSDWIRGQEDVLWAHHDHSDPNANRYRIYRLDSRPHTAG